MVNNPIDDMKDFGMGKIVGIVSAMLMIAFVSSLLGSPFFANSIGSSAVLNGATYTVSTNGGYAVVRNSIGTVVSNGTDVSHTVQHAYSALTSGGSVYWSAGSYLIDETIKVPYGVRSFGSGQSDDNGGYGGTCLTRTGNFSIFNMTDIRHVSFADMTFKGHSVSSGNAPLVRSYGTCGNFVFDRCTFTYSDGDGFYWGGDSYWLTMSNCQGVYINGRLLSKVYPDSGTTLVMENCIAHYSGGVADLYGVRGVSVIGGGCDNLDYGAYLFTLCSGTIQNVDIEGLTTGHGIETVQGCMNIRDNRFWGCGDGYTYFPIKLGGNNNGAVVSGNFFEDTAGTCDVSLSADCENVNLIGNSMLHGIIGYNTNATVQAVNNRGFQTIVWGNVSGVYNGNQITFPYELYEVPNIIEVSASGVGDLAGHTIVAGYDYRYSAKSGFKVMLWDATDSSLVWTPDTCVISYRAEYRP